MKNNFSSTKYFSQEAFPNLEKRYRTRLINSLSGFKSLNLVATVSAKGATNLSLVSSVFHLGANPALMGFIMRPVSATRDTYNNILETGYYTFNHIQESFYQQAHQCAARYAPEASEFEATGLSPVFKNDFKAPYVAESNIQIGLSLQEQIPIPLNGTILIIGAVEEMYLPEEVVGADGYIDIGAAGSITCSGLDAYHTTQKLKRLSYPKVDKSLVEFDF